MHHSRVGARINRFYSRARLYGLTKRKRNRQGSGSMKQVGFGVDIGKTRPQGDCYSCTTLELIFTSVTLFLLQAAKVQTPGSHAPIGSDSNQVLGNLGFS